MVNPVPGHAVTTPYQQRPADSAQWQPCGWHTGQDYAADHGVPVVAARAGRAEHIGQAYGPAFGIDQIVVTCDDGTEDFYAHLLRGTGRFPRDVDAGEQIGEVGSDGGPGSAIEPHLHFERHRRQGHWGCDNVDDPMKSHDAPADSGSSSSAWRHPAGTKVYAKYLRWKGHEQNSDDHSTSIECWQEMLNRHPLAGGATLPITGRWFELTDAETRKCQDQHVPPADPVGEAFVGPQQFEHVKQATGCPYMWVGFSDSGRQPADARRPVRVMHGIDISSHQAGIDVSAVPAEFVIVKTTEGQGWPAPGSPEAREYKRQYDQAVAAGRLVGLYHFARNDTGNTPEAEADNFIASVESLHATGKAVLVLDWEREPLDDVAWATRFVDHVRARLGVRVMMYMSESVTRGADWSALATRSPLWVAKYSSAEPAVNWPTGWVMWQWSDAGQLDGYPGPLDVNRCTLSVAEWHALASRHE